MGDPKGIGPEVVAKAICDPAIARLARFVVYGQNQLLVDAAERVVQRMAGLNDHALDMHPLAVALGVRHRRRIGPGD